MNNPIPSSFSISPEIARSISINAPIVALETTVLTHGLPTPDNLALANALNNTVLSYHAMPATIGVLDGKVIVGMSEAQITELVNSKNPVKVSSRNLGICVANKNCGGTTVAGTLVACRITGIRVFATGGIGGVHRGSSFDVSADLDELARSPVIVVCAGAKSILDLPATLEVLETRGVPVIGYQTDEFPAFYSSHSGLPVDATACNPSEVVEIAREHWAMGLPSAILVCVPPPKAVSMDPVEVELALQNALLSAEKDGIARGKITPYLLSKMNELTHGKSLETNLALLQNNAQIAAEIAVELSGKNNQKTF